MSQRQHQVNEIVRQLMIEEHLYIPINLNTLTWVDGKYSISHG